MFFQQKKSTPETPMDQFLNRDNLNGDERAVLDVYLTGVVHALTSANSVQTSNTRDPLFSLHEGQDVSVQDLENLIAEFLKQRPDMQTQSLGLCATMALMQRFPA